MRNWLQRVMAGRYGVDHYNRFLNTVAMVCLILSIFLNNVVGTVFWFVAIVALIWSYVRMFSRNTAKRRAENNAYLTLRYNMTRKFTGLKQRMEQKQYYRFYKCPKCNVTIRVPKGKGKIRITCPKCGESFVRKS